MPVDSLGNRIGHPYPVSIGEIVEWNGIEIILRWLIYYSINLVPIMAYGSKGAIINTACAPVFPKTAQPKEPLKAKTVIDNIEINNWESGNRFPSKTDEIINKAGELNSRLKFIRNLTLG